MPQHSQSSYCQAIVAILQVSPIIPYSWRRRPPDLANPQLIVIPYTNIKATRPLRHYTNDGRLARPGQAGRQSALEQQQRRTSDAGCRGRPPERLSQLGAVHHADAQSWSEGFQEMYVVSVLLLLPVAFRADSVFVS